MSSQGSLIYDPGLIRDDPPDCPNGSVYRPVVAAHGHSEPLADDHLAVHDDGLVLRATHREDRGLRRIDGWAENDLGSRQSA